MALGPWSFRQCLTKSPIWIAVSKRAFTCTSSYFKAGQKWTTSETEKLRDLLQQKKSTWEVANHFPHRGQWSLLKKAGQVRRLLGLNVRSVPLRPWTAADLQTLRQANAQGLNTKAIHELLPDRTWIAIHMQLEKLRLGTISTTRKHLPFSNDECEELVRLREVEALNWREIATKLERPVNQILRVYQTRVKWTPTKLKDYRPWSEEEESALAKLLSSGRKAGEIAEQMQRTYPSVQSKISALHKNGSLSNEGDKHVSWTPEDERRLWEGRVRGDRFKTLAAALGRTEKSVQMKHRKLVSKASHSDTER